MRSMTKEERTAMRDALLYHHYRDRYTAVSPEQLLYDYILLLAYLDESRDRFTEETRQIYMVIYAIHQ